MSSKDMHRRIRIPNFTPRDYQVPFLGAMDDGIKRAVLVFHRRAGKEIICWNFMIKQAFWHRVGTYVYFFPTSTLGRRILWDGANKEGRRFLDYIPKEIIEGNVNSNEMKVRLTNGSVIQVIGTDQIVNVGINPVGCVFSEFSIQDPKSWNYTRPILRENDGWAVFNGTPRGKNHLYDMYLMAKNNPDWFCQKLTIDDTSVLNEADMDAEREEGMSEHLIQQEYYCDFNLGAEGAYYAKYLNKADLEGRLTFVACDPNCAVDTYWDLGVSDETVILVTQNIGNQIHIINMYRNQGEGLNHYARWIETEWEKWGYITGTHHAPHDIKVRELGSGAQTRLQIAKDLGIQFDIVPNISIQEGIELARGMFPRIWIDTDKCKYLIKALENYHKKFNETLNVYGDKPVHDWSSHSCFVAGTLIETDNSPVPIESLKIGDFVKTPTGYKKVKNTYSKSVKNLVKVSFGGNEVVCTPEHKFFTSDGLITTDAMRYNTRLYTLEDKWKNISSCHGENLGFRDTFLSIEKKRASYLKDTSIDGMDFIIDVELQRKTLIHRFSELFGLFTMGKFLKDIKSITSMVIPKTTILKTLKTLTVHCICTYIWMMKEKIKQENLLIKQENMQKYGTLVKKVKVGTENMQKISGLEKILYLWYAKSVKNLLLAKYIIKNIVQMPVKLNLAILAESTMKIDNVFCVTQPFLLTNMQKKKLAANHVQLPLESQDVTVYDLEVEEDHCYYANGLLVSNCDAFRYLAIMQSKAIRGHMSEDDANTLERTHAFRH